ncbi:MAG: Gfo/Idh/MocA family oxidoreductase [Planctomycetes bacterium]|nr:Gfo/Idh/MocA family oxidoreductase [Planctomycetota bacterium]
MTTLRAGLSGCGAAGLRAVLAARRQQDAVVVAAHDADPAALAALQQATGIALGTTRFDELLGTGVDFVVLAGPPGSRLEQVELAAEQGVPVLLLAPMAPSLAAAEAMAAACARGGVALGVAIAAQADPRFEQLRRAFADGWFGGLLTVHALRGDDDLVRRPAAAGDPRLASDLFGDDPMVRLAVEDVHLLPWLTGRRCLRVTCQAGRSFLPLAADGAVATAVLAGGAVATFAATLGGAARGLAIQGTDGFVQVAGDTVVVRGERAFAGPALVYATPGQTAVLSPRDDADARRLATQLEPIGRFARWLDDLDGFPCPAQQALADMRAVAAMQRALASGRVEVV